MERTTGGRPQAAGGQRIVSVIKISPSERRRSTAWGAGRRLIGPEEAKELLSHNIRNRRIAPARVQQYAEDMRRGLWREAGADSIVLWEDAESGEAILANGQHRLQAVILAGTRHWFEVRSYTSEQISLRDLYASMDQNGVRTAVHWIEVEQLGGSGETRREAARHLAAGLSAIILLEVSIRGLLDGTGGVDVPRVSMPQKEAIWLRFEPDIRWAASLRMRQTKGRRKPLPVGILAAAVACHRIADAEAKEFFTAVAYGADLHEGSAAFALRDLWLRGGDPRRTKQARDAGRYWYGLAVNAWNHHCLDERVDFLRALDLSRCVIRKPRRRIAPVNGALPA